MKDIDFTLDQKKALMSLQFWWNKGNPQKQVFELAGYAGTGKTTILKYFLQTNSIEKDDLKFTAYTGKASLVMRNKNGFDATTIHRLIYFPEVIPEKEVPELDEEGNPKKDKDGNYIMKKIPRKLVFNLKEHLDDDIKLIIVDECSMVPEKMWEDLKSFSIPILVVGDIGQLKPVFGECPLLKSPDVEMKEVVRQAEGSDIIRIATLARKKDWINRKDFKNSPNVTIITPEQLLDEDLEYADIVLCGKNTTRDEMNKRIRKIKGLTANYPVMGEKLICRNNNYGISSVEKNYQLINGMIGYLTEPIDTSSFDKKSFKISFKPDFAYEDGTNDFFYNIKASVIPFMKNLSIKDRMSKYGFRAEDENIFEFGYCITTHLSQGSSWKKVIVIDEWMGDVDFHAKWLYTAITRAEEELLLVTKNPGWDW